MPWVKTGACSQSQISSGVPLVARRSEGAHRVDREVVGDRAEALDDHRLRLGRVAQRTTLTIGCVDSVR
jgi:hypothetical protein